MYINISYMNFFLKDIPKRENKPRESGITMMMDKGLSLNQAKDFIESSSEYTDIVKLGFGTSLITPNTHEKIKLYQEANIKVHVGGTLFEAFVVRDMYKEYLNLMDKWNISMCEVSDGCMNLNHDDKCNYIKDLSKKYTVVSEVGSKDSEKNIDQSKWIDMMKKELESGSWKVITESREGGNTGVFNNQGETKDDFINDIINEIPNEKIIWEAPKKEQQLFFINNIGPNVNLGNISKDEVIPLEALRLGLRGDTFFKFIN